LRDAGWTTFEDVLALAPNLNWSGDASLPRYVPRGPIGALDSSFRLTAQHYYTNGHLRDIYLNRDGTNEEDEINRKRAQLRPRSGEVRQRHVTT